jgi:23S rRNA (cytosine1962-C5)-methyltransferase
MAVGKTLRERPPPVHGHGVQNIVETMVQRALARWPATLGGAHRLLHAVAENGFVIDLYGKTIVMFDHRVSHHQDFALELAAALVAAQPAIAAIVWKVRKTEDSRLQMGVIVSGDASVLDRRVEEEGVHYSIELMRQQDATLYLDTRCLRRWIRAHSAGKTVLNLFAYTASLGVAAKAGGATRVVNIDRNSDFLSIGKQSYTFNQLPVSRRDFIARDFFVATTELKRAQALFDIVILDPPFFSSTSLGRVDVENDLITLINKVRPLVAHEGQLVCVNNGLFVPGVTYSEQLKELEADGYVTFQERIDVDDDCLVTGPPADPTPFNSPTKIAVLHVTRKDKRAATDGAK